MRRFTDDGGTEWTAALSSGSYGSMALVFAATGDSGHLYWLALEAETAAEAQDLLRRQTDDELRERLARAEPWSQ